MPHYVVNKVNDALNEFSKSIKNSKILIVGVSYKKDIDDLRESPALDVIQLLQKRGAKVQYHDPFVPEIRFDSMMFLSSDLEPALRSSDCTVIVTNHSQLDYHKIVELSPVVLDARNATKGIKSRKIIKL